MRTFFLRYSYVFASVLCLCGCVSPTVHSFGTAVVPLRWTPNESEVARCEQLISREVSHAGLKLERYCVKMYAYEKEGRKVIVGYAADCEMPGSNGLLTPETSATLSDPSFDPTMRLGPYGGGTSYFEFRYDRERARLTEFHFNAPL